MSRRRATDPRQTDLFTAARPVTGDASFAGIDAWVSAEVGLMLKDDPRSREEIAGAVSALVAEDVSRWMLDAYASPARDAHNISFGRALVLMAATQHRELIEQAVGRLGGTILWGKEIAVAELGQIDSEIARLKDRRRHVAASVEPINRGKRA